MTPPALVVLTLALVCSNYGTATEQTADRASEHVMNTKQNAYNPNTSNKMRAGTNNENYIVNNGVAFISVNNKQNRFNSVYTKTGDIVDKEMKSNDRFVFRQNNMKNKEFNKDASIQTNRNLQRIKQQKFGEIIIDAAEYRSNYKDNNELYKEEEEFFDDQISKRSKSIMSLQKHLNFGNKGKRVFNLYGDSNVGRIKRQAVDTSENCDGFKENPIATEEPLIYHPHNGSSKNYYSNTSCVRVLKADEGFIITITFIDMFHIEEHPKCAYDYLEVRDGEYGYSKLLGRLCGDKFPSPIRSTGPRMWLKFKSDETIEYEGFTIKVEHVPNVASHKIPAACYITMSGETGVVDVAEVPKECKQDTANHALDVLWEITVKENHAIYLNFTLFELARPNECEENLVQIFGAETEEDKALEHYCGSAANAVTTKSEDKKQVQENVMHVRIYLSEKTKSSKVIANYTAFRTLDPNKDEKCNKVEEFDCEDNTCIASNLYCDNYANCRLKADEDPDKCLKVTTTLLQQDHILIILVIFSVILSGMSFVFLFKCIKKLYQDHKAIKEHIRQSTEDRLDTLMTGSLLLDPKNLREPRASLERENHTNELYKQQRSISQHKGMPKQPSIESDFQETRLDLDDERDLTSWRQDVDVLPEPDDINMKAERNGRTRRSDTSKKEEALKSRKESIEEKKEIRDAAVGAPDTKESGCQTRESLFQADTAPSSDGSNSASNSRGFSTFGYSGATLVRPSPPPAAPAPAPMISSKQIELLRQLPSMESTHKTQKKLTDRRPMSAETTRSAPDVIIVSKPIR